MLIHGEIKLLALPGQEVQSEVKDKLKLDEQNIKISLILAPHYMLNSHSSSMSKTSNYSLFHNSHIYPPSISLILHPLICSIRHHSSYIPAIIPAVEVEGTMHVQMDYKNRLWDVLMRQYLQGEQVISSDKSPMRL